MKRKEGLFLKDIIESIENIKKFTKSISKEEFIKNRLIQDAVIREIEIIGEAVKHISDDIKERYPEIEWKNISGTRDIFIHGYFQVNLEKVWDIVKNNLDNLKQNILKVKVYVDSKEEVR
ncbi:DUF86 domain-containing protein [Candidatus Woesearchaeota archaeon]|nr:DUF86 domain-containing protein [Candidatus Woesearchaeota archaeon]